ncbi:MAG: LamG domain-containing protein, partial [Bacteroidota bacterium]
MISFFSTFRAVLITVVISTLLASNSYCQEDGLLRFDGNDDYVALDMSYHGSNTIAEVTVEAWIKTSFSGGSWNGNWAIVDFDRSEYYNLFVNGDNGTVGFSTNSGGMDDFYGVTVVNDDQWHHIAAVYDGVDKHIYVDGVLDGSRTNPHNGNALGSNNTRFGIIGDGSEASSYNGSKNNVFYDGDISELRIWHTTRS